jgi:hypothetical protein
MILTLIIVGVAVFFIGNNVGRILVNRETYHLKMMIDYLENRKCTCSKQKEKEK